MYASRTTQFIVGIFAILGIVALAILSLSLGKISLFPPPGYTLYASFDNISGLKTGDQVQLAGVQIGKVVNIGLKDYRARVALRVNEGVEIDDDAIAAIKTSGIIGDKYVSIQLGPSDQLPQRRRHDSADPVGLRARGRDRPADQQLRQQHTPIRIQNLRHQDQDSNCNCADTTQPRSPKNRRSDRRKRKISKKWNI